MSERMFSIRIPAELYETFERTGAVAGLSGVEHVRWMLKLGLALRAHWAGGGIVILREADGTEQELAG